LNYATKLNSLKCKIVARLHGIEVYEWFKKLEWKFIDKIICSPPQYLRIKNRFPELIDKTEVLPIGTDVYTFKIKKESYGKKLCMVGWVSPRKRFYTTIETVLPLLRTGWTLHIRGKVSDIYRTQLGNEYAQFMNELLEHHDLIDERKVLFYPSFMPKEQYCEWFKDKDIIINNSIQEGYGKSTFDAMACGVYPLVNNWYGADTLFRDVHIFNSQQELLDKINWWDNRTDKEKLKHSKEARLYVENGHDEKSIATEIRRIMETV